MRVIYGNEVNTTVPDGTSPSEILGILKESYAELSNADYNIATEADEQVMRITLKSGSKA